MAQYGEWLLKLVYSQQLKHMAYSYIVDSTATQVESGYVGHAVITVNLTAAQTVKIIDGTSGSTANVATIAACTQGNVFHYYGLKTGLRVIASGTVDITAATVPTGVTA